MFIEIVIHTTIEIDTKGFFLSLCHDIHIRVCLYLYFLLDVIDNELHPISCKSDDPHKINKDKKKTLNNNSNPILVIVHNFV